MKFVQQQQRGYQRWKVKHVVCAGLLLLCCAAVFLCLLSWYRQARFAARFTESICEHYKKGVISGSLCSSLCTTQSVYLEQHVYQEQEYEVFQWQKMLIKVNAIHGDKDALQFSGGSMHYTKPEKGTSMEDFRSMVHIFVEAKLGQGDHKILIDAIMDKADANKDDKVSLAEAKTIWALLQHNEIFMSILFSDCEHIPKLHSFCGDNYAMEIVPNSKLYEKGASVWEHVFQNYYTWGFPTWHDRVRISVGLLEFTSEAYQHGTEGPFYMCSANEKAVGFTNGHDVKIMGLSQVYSEQELSVKYKNIKCTHNIDCVIGTECTSFCDKTKGICSTSGIRPNLFHVCRVIQGYISLGIGEKLEEEFNQLLDRCFKLEGYSSQHEVEHSLVLNDLKSLLWKQIS